MPGVSRTLMCLLRNHYLRPVVLAGLLVGLPAVFQPVHSGPPIGMTVQPSENSAGMSGCHAFKPGLERPACDDTTFLLINAAGRYSFRYDTLYRQAAWVAYLLTRADVETKGKRGGSFRRDPDVVERGWPSASDADYVRSGYDRGHLLPSADRNGSTEENQSTFYFSNISPQHGGFNRKIWKYLEEQIRRWAVDYDSLYVVTGPWLNAGLPRIGGNEVGVPGHYFKALLVRHEGAYHAVGFLIPNLPLVEGRFLDYAFPVNELEHLLGYDFFYQLPDSIQCAAESVWNPDFWR